MAERNRFSGKIAFSAYLGNTLRYDVDLGTVTFKSDIGDPWHHEQLPMGAPETQRLHGGPQFDSSILKLRQQISA